MGFDITKEERAVADNLIKVFLEKKDLFPFVNLNTDGTYSGWVTDFGVVFPDGESMWLDLKKGNDLFLLFVLAVAWSRTGIWENAAFLTAYLKHKKKDNYHFWKIAINYKVELENRKVAVEYSSKNFRGIKPRKKLSFREDIYRSIHTLALHWEDILKWLQISEQQDNYNFFIEKIRGIEGLGVGNKRILIKIPLILRELRCQEVYQNIPGEYCCVPDDRVVDSCKELGINFSKATDLKSLLKRSTKIYRLFGDLYDLPLFAFPDLKEDKILRVEGNRTPHSTFFSTSIQLQNQQLLLRPLEANDIDLIESISYSDELGEFGARVKSRADLEHYFDFCMTAKKKEELYPLIIISKEEAQPIGITMFGNISLGTKRLEIGWTWIGEQYQGTGINQQCKKLLLDYCFQELSLRRVEFKIDIKNIKSQKAIAKLGAVKEGMLRDYNIQSYGESAGTYVYSILKEEWNAMSVGE